MSKTGEIRLEKEFMNLQALQQDPRIDGKVNIQYNPRGNRDRDHWVPIMTIPRGGLYPFRYRLTYTMPMFIGPDEERDRVDNWHASFIFEAPEDVLMNPHSNVNVALDGGFPCGVPYNNHVGAAWVCTGSAWAASRGMGIWYFVICLGCLLNQERFLIAMEPHLNGDALRWWIDRRNMQPNNNIQWPFDLLDKARKPVINFGGTKTPTTKPNINFGTTSKPQIKFGKTTY